jgi:hypothetical protein
MKVRKYYDVTIKQGEGNIDGKGIQGPKARKASLSHTFISAVDSFALLNHTRVASLHWKGHGMAFRKGTAQMRMVRYELCSAIEQQIDSLQ